MAASYVVRREATGQVTPQTLARIGFGAGDPRAAAPSLAIDTAQPFASGGFEHWLSRVPVHTGHAAGVDYAENGDVVFAQLRLEESALAQTEAATHDAYRRLDAFLADRGYPHLLRCWNFLHDLHRGAGPSPDDDEERYKQFVAGRYRAWSARPGFEQRLPAATVIGAAEGGLRIQVLAAREPGVPIENPRQTPAWKYPRTYGPRSPSFARALRKDWSGESHLYVSGTASVVGHETHHAADADAQLREIHTNMQALLAEAGGGWQPQSLKLYVRRAADFAPSRRLALTLWGDQAPFLWVQGDICRRDLLLEVEGVFTR